MAERQMAIDSAGIQTFPNGIPCVEPVFNLSAFWIMPEDRNRAEARGLTVVDASTVLVTHLAEVLRQNAAQLMGRDEVDELINYVRADAPKLVSELVPEMLSLGDVVAVLQNLLNERVSIRNLRTILEALAATAPHNKDPKFLTEEVRAALWRQITGLVKDSDGVVRSICFDRETEVVLRNSLSPHGALAPDPAVFHKLLKSLGETVKTVGEQGHTPCLVVGEDLRRPLYEMLKAHLPDLQVVALRELDRRADIQIVGSVSAVNES
jgi:flagellar biosynthesis protein FlhA